MKTIFLYREVEHIWTGSLFMYFWRLPSIYFWQFAFICIMFHTHVLYKSNISYIFLVLSYIFLIFPHIFHDFFSIQYFRLPCREICIFHTREGIQTGFCLNLVLRLFSESFLSGACLSDPIFLDGVCPDHFRLDPVCLDTVFLWSSARWRKSWNAPS